jgi:predicted nucleotidyltransferase
LWSDLKCRLYQLGRSLATNCEVVCYTPTYAGQSQTGETVEAAGWIEQTDDGARRLTAGTSREAAGQYVKVVT